MPLNKNIHKVMIIGSGPIVIGQAAEFDYAGNQACKALKSLGLEVCLVNSNPATLMTDKEMADEIYMEPLTLKSPVMSMSAVCLNVTPTVVRPAATPAWKLVRSV